MDIKKHLSSDSRVFIKALLSLSLPIMGQELLNTGVNLLDSLMIGQLGLGAINGVGFANQIFFLLAVVMFGVTSGSAIFMGQYWGKKDTHGIRRVMGLCFGLNMAVAVLFGLCALLIPEVLIGFYTKDPDALARGVEYIRVVAVTYFLFAVTACFNAALRSIGQTRLPMFTTLISLLCNGALNYVFIFVYDWNVTGAALATVIARSMELLAQFLLMRHRRVPVLGPIREYFAVQLGFVRDFFKLTAPVILNETIWAVGVTLYSVIYQLCGNEAQGAVQISMVIQNIFMVIGFGAGAGCGVLLANLLGAGERDRAIDYAGKGLKAVIFISLIMGGLLVVASPFVLMLYNVEPEVKSAAQLVMFVIATGFVFKTFNYTSIVGVLRSGGDTRYCLFLDLAGVWAIGVPLALIGAAVWRLPIHWVVALVYSEEIFKFFLSMRRVRSNVWANCVV